MTVQSELNGDNWYLTLTEAGVTHQKNDTPNQDAVDFVHIGDNYALVVADGVGSCICADIGAQAAVRAVLTVFSQCIQKKTTPIPLTDVVESIVNEWRMQITDYIEDQCCTTLKCAMKLEQMLYLFSIGDGFIAFSSTSNEVISPNGQFGFTNETMCMSSRTRPSDFWVYSVELKDDDRYSLFACTDGIANGICEGDELNLVSEINVEIPSNQLCEQLKRLFHEIAKVSFDDKTLGVIKYAKRNEES